jgi:methyl coenzyme M reductase subunit D
MKRKFLTDNINVSNILKSIEKIDHIDKILLGIFDATWSIIVKIVKDGCPDDR